MGPVDTFFTSIVVAFLGIVSKTIMTGLNDTTFIGVERFRELHRNRRKGQGLVTVSNHVSAVDDPGVVATLVPLSYLFQPSMCRWTMCATSRCFRNPVVSQLLRKGKVLPIERGKGLDQPMMDDIVAKVDQGDWVHMFPEGTRTRDGKLGKPRLGVSRLIAEPRIPPVVVPFLHSGMERILRRGEWIPVNAGQHLCVLVGEPIDFSDLVSAHKRGEMDRRDLHVAIAERIGEALRELQTRMDAIKLERPELATPPPDEA